MGPLVELEGIWRTLVSCGEYCSCPLAGEDGGQATLRDLEGQQWWARTY